MARASKLLNTLAVNLVHMKPNTDAQRHRRLRCSNSLGAGYLQRYAAGNAHSTDSRKSRSSPHWTSSAAWLSMRVWASFAEETTRTTASLNEMAFRSIFGYVTTLESRKRLPAVSPSKASNPCFRRTLKRESYIRTTASHSSRGECGSSLCWIQMVISSHSSSSLRPDRSSRPTDLRSANLFR